MISLVEALNYRCLRYIRQPLSPFHVLVGPNASGKTTFLDVIAFLGKLVSDGLESAIQERTQNFMDLVWRHSGDRFELALEAEIPEHLRQRLREQKFNLVRYEVAIGKDPQTEEVVILGEKAALMVGCPTEHPGRELFPAPPEPPATILTGRIRNIRTIVSKSSNGNDTYNSEVHEKPGKGWVNSFRFGPRKSAMGNLPGDETKFPVMTWFKDLLTQGVQQLVLNSLLIRRASPPDRTRGFKPDGSNLPWIIPSLRREPRRFADWIAHLRTALNDIADIKVVERPDDKHRYLKICYDGELEVPSWMASDGTLRLLALTLPAYLPEFKGVYLIEEPENGIHPRAVETVYQSLSSVYDAQILVATHSPVILSIAEPHQVLCFAKTEEGATDIVRGSEHPALQDWRGETNLGTLYASGVLG